MVGRLCGAGPICGGRVHHDSGCVGRFGCSWTRFRCRGCGFRVGRVDECLRGDRVAAEEAAVGEGAAAGAVFVSGHAR